MKTNVRGAIAALKQLQANAIAGAEEGLAEVAGQVTVKLRDTQAHGDSTGATRAGYVAYVVGPTFDGTGALGPARAAVEEHNPSHSQVSSVGSVGNDVVLIATSPTDYQKRLSFDGGGAKDALGPTIDSMAADLLAAAACGIKRRIEG